MTESKISSAQAYSSQKMGWSLILLLVLVTGIVLRFQMLGMKSLWLDEASSVAFARLPWHEFLRTMWYGEANMVLYYLLLRFWLHLGDSEFWLRSLSALFGVAAIPAIYAMGKRFLNRNAGLAAAALLAVHSFHIQYSQELRSYTLLTLLLILSTYTFLAALETPNRKALWALYAIFCALSLYTQVFAFFVLASQWLILTPGRIKRLGVVNVLSTGVAIAVLASPMVAIMFLENKGQLDWVPHPSLASTLAVLQDLAGTDSGSPLTVRSLALLSFYAVTWILAICGVFLTRLNRTEGPLTKLTVILLAGWFTLPVVAMLGISLLKPIFYPRYALMCVPACVLLAAQGLTTLAKYAPRGLLVSSTVLLLMILLSLSSVREYYDSFQTYGHDWRGVTRYILSQQEPGDAAVFYTLSGHRVFDYYLSRELMSAEALSSPAVLFPLSLDRASIEKHTEPYRRVWLVLHQTIPTAETDGRNESILKTLETHFRLMGEREFPGAGANRGENGTIRVLLYIAGPTNQKSNQ
jgi:mannosyltransferase